MDRRSFIAGGIGAAAALAAGCRGKQYARVMQPGEAEMVGSHAAGSETYKPLVEEAVARLLAREAAGVAATPVAYNELPPPAPPIKRICFVGVENKSIEEIGDFKEQLFEVIEAKISESQQFQVISQRFVQSGLSQLRLRPDDLFAPENMRAFAGVMEQAGQPIDSLLWAKVTSGTTKQNKDYQRDYLLTLEMVDVNTGIANKESAAISKGYHHSRLSRLNAGRWFK